MRNLLAVAFALVSTAPLSHAKDEPPPDAAQALLKRHSAPPNEHAGKDEVFGHSFSSFGDFYKTWKLVTVRYRQDSHEMRFTYANPAAWKALEAGGKKYPKGAVFAKIGFISQEDKAFASSLVPSGAKRFQFMVRDPEKFKDTDGWGYMLFNGKGKTFPEEPVQAAKACAACHKLVPDRAYVFSQMVDVEPFAAASAPGTKPSSPSPIISRVTFSDLSQSELPWELQRVLPPGSTAVRSLQGAMRANLFEGTLNEIRPVLAEETASTGKPAALLSDDKQQFSFTYLNPGEGGCPAGSVSIGYGMTVLSPTFVKTSGKNESEKVMKIGQFCYRASR